MGIVIDMILVAVGSVALYTIVYVLVLLLTSGSRYQRMCRKHHSERHSNGLKL
jgi:hypothetical protein